MRPDIYKCLAVILVLLVAGTLSVAEEQEASRIFVFRYDDYHGIADLTAQEAVIALFRDKGIPLTVSVIAARLKNNTEAIDLLVSSLGPTFEVALHGWDHYARVDGAAPAEATEFAGLPVAEQYDRIMKGISVLKGHLGVAPTTFAPPFNTYDSNTVEALQKAGIRILSADIRPREVEHGDIVCVPQTCLLHEIVNFKVTDLDSGLYVVVFHEHDFIEGGGKHTSLTLDDLDSLLESLSAEPGTDFSTIAALAEEEKNDFSVARLQAAQAVAAYTGTRLFGFPARWVRRMPAKYETTEAYEQLLRKAQRTGIILDFAAALGVLAMFAACYAVSARVHRTTPRALRRLWLLAPVGVAALLTLANIQGVLSGSPGFGYKDRITATVLAVFVLAWVLRLRQANRARKET
jgi:hypothetical protein